MSNKIAYAFAATWQGITECTFYFNLKHESFIATLDNTFVPRIYITSKNQIMLYPLVSSKIYLIDM